MEESDGGECTPFISSINKTVIEIDYFYVLDELVVNVN